MRQHLGSSITLMTHTESHEKLPHAPALLFPRLLLLLVRPLTTQYGANCRTVNQMTMMFSKIKPLYIIRRPAASVILRDQKARPRRPALD